MSNISILLPLGQSTLTCFCFQDTNLEALQCTKLFYPQGLTKTGDDYEVKAAHVELAERMRKVVDYSLFSLVS